MADETTHARPDQAEEPADDIGASNVDLDQARHGVAHPSPTAPEPAHAPDDHGHADDHAHDGDHPVDHPVDDPRWVLAPLVVGLVIGILVVIVLGLSSDAAPFNQL